MTVGPATGLLAERVKERLADLTRSERRIGEHLVKNPLDAAFLAAARLSDLVGVSESSVLRFARSLGYPSYPALQLEIQEEIRQRLTRNAPQRLQDAAARASNEVNVLVAALGTDVRNLQLTRQLVDERAFGACVEQLAHRQRVIVVGMRGAAPAAEFLGYSLNLLRPRVVVLVHQADMLGDQLMDLSKDDVLICYAFSRQSVHTVKAAELAKRAGALVLSVTDDPLSPVAVRSDHALVVATQSEAFIQSYTAAVAITHAILAAVGHRLQVSAMQRLTEIESVLDHTQAFYTEEG